MTVINDMCRNFSKMKTRVKNLQIFVKTARTRESLHFCSSNYVCIVVSHLSPILNTAELKSLTRGRFTLPKFDLYQSRWDIDIKFEISNCEGQNSKSILFWILIYFKNLVKTRVRQKCLQVPNIFWWFIFFYLFRVQ